MSRLLACLLALGFFVLPAGAAAQALPSKKALPPAQNAGGPAGPALPGKQPAGPPMAKPMGVPFILTDEEQAVLDLVLRRWQTDSAMINNLHCDIEVWENNPVFKKKTHTMGELKYEKPDKGMYHIKFDASGPKPVPSQAGPHWVCNGKSIFEFRYADKVLIENRLPPSIQGEALVHSPLPFLFGAQAEELKKRYFMKDTTLPAEREKGQIWLLAFPKYQADAANFIKAELILTSPTVNGKPMLLPYGMKMYLPNDQSDSSHVFKNYKINSGKTIGERVFGDIWSPKKPASDWELRVEEAPAEPSETASPEKPRPRIFNPLKLGGKPAATEKK